MIDFFIKPYYTGKNPVDRRRPASSAIIMLGLAVVMAAALLSGCASMKMADSGQPLNNMVEIYRGPLDHLNAVRTGTCPMHPSCSAYAIEATDRYGPAIGWMMAFDRMIRCGRNELKTAPKIPVNGKWRYHDPVRANDFWWNDPPEISRDTAQAQNSDSVE